MSSINSIQGFGPMQGMQGMEGMHRSATLTDDQKKQVQSILSKYDPNNLTAQDAQSIFEQFRDAGIRPGKGMVDAIKAAGFDAEKLRSLGMQGMPGIPGMQRMEGNGQLAELTDDQKKQVQSILSKYDPNNLTAQDARAIFTQFRDAGIPPAKGMGEAIEAAGFDAEKLRSLGMPQPDNQENLFWASQNSTRGLNTSMLQSLQQILSQYDVTNLSADEEKRLITQLQSLTQLQGLGQENSFWTSENGTQKLNTSALESFQSILSQYDFTNLSSDQEKSLFVQLQRSGLLQAGNLLNLGA
jgi:hypothetical protein